MTTTELDSLPRPDVTGSRERTAWGVLLGAFSLCIVLMVSVPSGGYWYWQNALTPRTANAQGTSGITLVGQPDLPGDAVLRLNAGEERDDIPVGSNIRTDGTSQLLVTFFDGSTLTIYPNSVVVLQEMSRPQFESNSQPDRLVVRVNSGRVRAQVSDLTDRPRHFEIQTAQAPGPTGGIVLERGSYAIETNNQMTHVSVRVGSAQVKGQTGNAIQLVQEERAEIPLGSAAVGPLPARRNLLDNPNFERLEAAVPISGGPLAEGWTVVSAQGGDGGTVDGTVEVVTAGVARALHFVRRASNNNHGETTVIQQLNALVKDYNRLALRFDVRIVEQSLSGGGVQSSEFPLMVRVDYQDQYGSEYLWTHGFYCQNTAGYTVLGGTELPCDTLRSFEFDLMRLLNNPTTITSVEWYASGWDWNAYVSDVEMVAE